MYTKCCVLSFIILDVDVEKAEHVRMPLRRIPSSTVCPIGVIIDFAGEADFQLYYVVV